MQLESFKGVISYRGILSKYQDYETRKPRMQVQTTHIGDDAWFLAWEKFAWNSVHGFEICQYTSLVDSIVKGKTVITTTIGIRSLEAKD
eukprot:scaffold7344_cov145-Cylindrotheca_fusiformis.AAC.11